MVIFKENIGDKIFNIVNLLILTIVMIVILYPLIFIISASISNPDLVNTGKVWLFPREITFEGYKRVFQDPDILIGYRNTIFYTVVGTLINLFLTLTAAYSLSKKRLIGRNALMFFMAFTMYFGGGMIPTYILMKNLHILNTYFVLLVSGAISTYNLIIARTFFANGVPQELEEAAIIDGCSTTKTFLLIVLPLSKALIGVLALYYGIAHWNSYFGAMIYLSDRGKMPLQLILREILVQNQLKADMMTSGIAANDELNDMQQKIASLIKYGVIIVSSVPVLIVYPFLQKYFDQGVMLGAVKG